MFALAMGAQAQGGSTEWYNPFEKEGAYNYVSGFSEQKYNTWFINPRWEDDTDLYPCLEQKSGKTVLRVTNNVLNFFLKIDDLLNTQKCCFAWFTFSTNVKIFDKKGNEVTPDFSWNIGATKFENPYEYFNNQCSLSELETPSFRGSSINTGECQFEISHSQESIGYKFIFIKIYCSNDYYYYFDNMQIVLEQGTYKGNKKEVFNERYFYEPYVIDTHTAITNTLESSAYVSNNVLYTDEPSNVCIYNTCGVIVKKEHNVTTLDLSDLKKGVYIAKVNDKTILFVK